MSMEGDDWLKVSGNELEKQNTEIVGTVSSSLIYGSLQSTSIHSYAIADVIYSVQTFNQAMAMSLYHLVVILLIFSQCI